MINSRPSINLPWWRFLLPLGLQLAVILFVPARSAYTYNFGLDAVIQTVPVDPYDLLRGYSQTLRYDISSASDLQQLPGGKNLSPRDIFYVILAVDSPSATKPPAPWKAIRVTQDLPQDLPNNQVAIKGKVEKYRTVSYGLETYYMPESQREKINQEIRNLQGDSDGNRAFVVEIKVDRWGNAVPVSLWVGDNNYRF